MLRPFQAAVAREWRDQWRWTLGLALGATMLALAFASNDGRGLTPVAATLAVAPVFAAAALPASVVDDAGGGLVRLVATQPLPRGAYALLRIGAASTLLAGLLAPLLLGLGAATGDVAGALRSLPALLLAVLWCASLAVVVGLCVRGSGGATALWLLVAGLNLQMALMVLSGVPMDDALLRVRHALPAAPAAQIAMPDADPWRMGALVLLALESLLLTLLAWRHAAHGWRGEEGAPTRARGTLALGALLALLLPFLLPLSPEALP